MKELTIIHEDENWTRVIGYNKHGCGITIRCNHVEIDKLNSGVCITCSLDGRMVAVLSCKEINEIGKEDK